MAKKQRKTWMVLALAAVLATLYCNYALDLEDWTVSSPLLPAPFDGLRVTLLTDLHGAEYGKNSERLLDAVARSAPDLIAISGDLADKYTDPEMLDPLLKGLTALAPTYYVTGNHEWVREDTEILLDRISACGVTVLRNDYVVLTREGRSMVLAGTEDPNGYADMETPEHLMERIRADRGGGRLCADALSPQRQSGDVVRAGSGSCAGGPRSRRRCPSALCGRSAGSGPAAVSRQLRGPLYPGTHDPGGIPGPGGCAALEPAPSADGGADTEGETVNVL